MSKRITDLQIQSALQMTDRLAIERPGNLEAQGIEVQQLVNLFKANAAAGASPYVEIIGNVLPNLTNKPAAYSYVGADTFTQTTGGSFTTTEPLNEIGWDGTSWHFVKTIIIGNTVSYLPENNIVQLTDYVAGYMSLDNSGGFVPDPAYWATTFLDVSFLSLNKQLTIKNISPGYVKPVHYYDQNKNVIQIPGLSAVGITITGTTAVFNGKPTADTKYIRVTVKTASGADTTDIAKLNILQSDVAGTDYIPYTSVVANINGRAIASPKSVALAPVNPNSPASKDYVDRSIQNSAEIVDPVKFQDAAVFFSGFDASFVGGNLIGWVRPGAFGKVNKVTVVISKNANTPDNVTFKIGYADSIAATSVDTNIVVLSTTTVSKADLPSSFQKFTIAFSDVVIPDGKVLVVMCNQPITIPLFTSPKPNVTNYSLLYRQPGDTGWTYGFMTSSGIIVEYENKVLSSIIKDQVSLNSLGSLFSLKGKKFASLGDSITVDPDSWAGYAANILGMSRNNFAVSGARYNDFFDGSGNNITPIDFSGLQSNGNGNTISNQVRRLLQWTTPLNQQIAWTHPVTGEAFSIPTASGVGLGNTTDIPDIIVIAASTNDDPTIPAGEEWMTTMGQSLAQLTRKALYSSIRWAVETLMINYPKAQIFLATPIQGDARRVYPGVVDRRERVITVGNYFNCQIIDASYESGISERFEKTATAGPGRYEGDGLHPHALGKQLMGNYFALQIRNKYFPRP